MVFRWTGRRWRRLQAARRIDAGETEEVMLPWGLSPGTIARVSAPNVGHGIASCLHYVPVEFVRIGER